jgi:SAM-dependent methyltransferase
MLSKDAEHSLGYRQVLYANYRATQFSALNADESADRTPEFDADYAGLLPQSPAARILDVGCGMGHFLQYLRIRGYQNIVGIDISPDQVAFCRSRKLENVELVEDVFGYLERHAGTFDLLNMSDVIEHFTKDEIVRLLLVAKEALNSGGRLIIRAPNIAGICGLYGRYIDFTHEIAFSEQSLRQVLLATGFQDIMVRGNRIATLLRPKRLLFILARQIWFFILRFIYTIEVGTDRPTIYAKNLIASATKPLSI